MYCPQCGIESSQQYCRSCGANLKVIGKAVILSEAIARSDRGPLPKIKEMMKGLKLDKEKMKGMKIERVTEDISHALEQMNREIVHSFDSSEVKRWVPWKRQPLTPEQRRERAIRKGVESLFSGIGLSIFLYYLAGAIVLRIPPEVLARIPFELEPVVRIIWLVGAIPIFSGLGKIISGLLIRPAPKMAGIEAPQQSMPAAVQETSPSPPHSVTDHTTELLH